jgi:CRP-like cAMP-binding protein
VRPGPERGYLAEDNEGRAPSTRGVFATALRNRSLVLVELSWLTFNGAEWGVWLALIQDVPRTATVTALTDAQLYSLEKEPFILALTGHAPAARAAGEIVSQRLGGLDAP